MWFVNSARVNFFILQVVGKSYALIAPIRDFNGQGVGGGWSFLTSFLSGRFSDFGVLN